MDERRNSSMSTTAQTAIATAFDVVDDSREFFAPVDSDVLDMLLGQYASTKTRIEVVAEFVAGELKSGNAIHYFLEGNRTEDRGRWGMQVSAEQLFDKTGAVKALNSAYWSKALALTDVLDTMPQKRRDEWNKTITDQTAPEFEAATVRATMGDLLRMRSKFFSERVDGIFRGLSGDHVTNQPQGFSARMIIGYMLNYGLIRHERAGLINDLRCVIAKFMGRDEPKYTSSDILVSELYKCTGQWVTVDGGTLRIRVYKKGTAHLEVHPDIAWRLNQVLASMYPLAIPAEFRAKPKKKAKDFVMFGKPLPTRVLELIGEGLRTRNRRSDLHVFNFFASARDQKAIYTQAYQVLESLGGVVRENGCEWEFNYPFEAVLRELVVSGCLPDRMAHQYYPTPAKLALIAVELADIKPTDRVLEPSAGQGGIAQHLPKDQTTCVEISRLHCAVLTAKGFNTIESDFLAWAATANKFDVVVMNPPYSEGRAKSHTEAAASLINPGGRLVSILPASMAGKDFLPGFKCEWSPVYPGEFEGTGTAVVILLAKKMV